MSRNHVPPLRGTMVDPKALIIRSVLLYDNYFRILGLKEQETSPEIVRKAFRRLALDIHPDKCDLPDATAAFQRISEAFEELYDSHSQRMYLGNILSFQSRKKPSKKRNRAYSWETKDWAAVERELLARELEEERTRLAFLGKKSSDYDAKQLDYKLKKALRVKEELDERAGFSEEEDSETNLNPIAELKSVVEYLRKVHLYCLYCGTSFCTTKELNETCPGSEEHLHE